MKNKSLFRLLTGGILLLAACGAVGTTPAGTISSLGIRKMPAGFARTTFRVERIDDASVQHNAVFVLAVKRGTSLQTS